ncbi:hypothetical protein BG60_23525 [Caballeronia zhejiangensis]|uniref:Uncharacterized protein n=1 Tax=Caballeronia zhejiangensis TaxID=871203 RepID=A0A656QDG3_9BURK|nr:metal-dependent phosphohydrolase HD sub domain-containing protein [Burkholderia sp. SJ98]KDR26308.1 hypothetical protein BG60_23525 [Caballeronia zhejiangensis]
MVQLVTAGVALDVLGFAYDEFTEEQRLQVVNAHPRGEDLEEQLIDAFNEGMKRVVAGRPSSAPS